MNESIINKLKSIQDNDIIILSDGTKIKVADITDVHSLNSLDHICDTYQSKISFAHDMLSMERFVNKVYNISDRQINHSFISSTLTLNGSTDSPIRENSKWILRSLVTSKPFEVTLIKYDDSVYIVEDMSALSSLIQFIYMNRPISGVSVLGVKELYYKDLDSKAKERLLSLGVSITEVTSKCGVDDTEYLNLVSGLYNIPQYAQFKLRYS